VKPYKTYSLDHEVEIPTGPTEWSAAFFTVYDKPGCIPDPTVCFKCNDPFLVGDRICVVLAELERKEDPGRTEMTFQLAHVFCK
jgi:hypothetical protein